MATPVQRQYFELKNQNPSAILFFRLGDFYELFYEDAYLCSRILGITLTARHRNTENEMPMCGFPHHSYEEYLEKLLQAGYKVAIAEQQELPDGRIIRKIDRVVTPGTTLEKGILQTDTNNFLASVFIDFKKNNFALAYTDLSTGEFRTAQFLDEILFLDEIYKIDPKEILVPVSVFQNEDFCKKLPKSHFTPCPDIKLAEAENCLLSHFSSNYLEVSGLGKLAGLLSASAQILNYLRETQKNDCSHIQKILRYEPNEVMPMDAQTFRHLEIFSSIDSDGKNSTLWSVFSKTGTAMGARALRHWLANPLRNAEKINERLFAVEETVKNFDLSEFFKKNLPKISDLERLLARISHQRGSGRELAFFRDSLAILPELKKVLEKSQSNLFLKNSAEIGDFSVIHQKLSEALVEIPPPEITVGGIFRTGYHAKLDELREYSRDSQKWLDEFLARVKRESGIQNLKVKYSQNFGFCLELSKAQAVNAPNRWIRRQTLVNGERFTTPELAEYEKTILRAESESFALEHQLFLALREEFLTQISTIQKTARAVAVVDAIFALAETAKQNRWNKPEISEEDAEFLVVSGRHPTVERISGTGFIANHLRMEQSASRFHLITGPNMAGKSTFLRQNALIILLGQMGSFVPATRAKFGVFDRIFTRIGASDNLAAGKSTFFVEMTETAAILHAATEKSFIILDEIGRGTSTFDGLSLAWAIAEFLHDHTKSKTLFATHYHELIDLAENLSAAENFHVSVAKESNNIVFLRQIKKGGIADSFGIEVARIAGIPRVVIQNAKTVLKRLESENLLWEKPNLFSIPKASETVVEIKQASNVEKFLATINPDELSPKAALEKLYEMKKIV